MLVHVHVFKYTHMHTHTRRGAMGFDMTFIKASAFLSWNNCTWRIMMCMSNVLIYVIVEVCLTVHPAFLCAFMLDISTDFSPKCFRTFHALCVFGFHHFIPLSVTLTLAGVHKISAKQNLWVFLAHFSNDHNEVMRQFMLNILVLFLSDIY